MDILVGELLLLFFFSIFYWSFFIHKGCVNIDPMNLKLVLNSTLRKRFGKELNSFKVIGYFVKVR